MFLVSMMQADLYDEELLQLLASMVALRLDEMDSQTGGPSLHKRIDDYQNTDCKNLFRFSKSDLYQLYLSFNIHEEFKLPAGHVVNGEEALLIMLRRFASAGTWESIRSEFGWYKQRLSDSFYACLDHIYEAKKYLLTNLERYSYEDFEDMTTAVQSKTGRLPHIFAFIDGTVRPTRLQAHMVSTRTLFWT